MRDLGGMASTVELAVNVSRVIPGRTRWVSDTKIVLGQIERSSGMPVSSLNKRGRTEANAALSSPGIFDLDTTALLLG